MSSTIVSSIQNFSLESASGLPFYRQIIRQIEDAVLSGGLPVGTKLPTIRSLAIQLKINPNTIAKAYAELELRGIVITQVGSGTYIAESNMKQALPEREILLQDLVRRTVADFAALGIAKDGIQALIDKFEEDV